MNELILPFSKIDKGNIPEVGGKGANLGEMVKSGFPVPDGFAVTTNAYKLFIEDNFLSKKISDYLKITDVNDPAQLDSTSKSIQKLINSSRIPKLVEQEIIKAYKKLSGFKNSLVAVRSSATAEDLPDASFAGQQSTFLNILGESNLINSVRECWASLYTARAIFYRVQNKISTNTVGISVIVQKMVQSDVSGVSFSIDPVTNAKDRIVIEAVWGLGELIVQGSVTPDRYVVQKETFSILSKEIAVQEIQLTKVGLKTVITHVPEKLKEKEKLTDDEIITLAKLSHKLQMHYYHPQDTEWAKEGKNIFIVQTRPVTTLKPKSIKSIDKNTPLPDTPILTGAPASPGIGTGIVKIVKNAKEIGKVKTGDVLVSTMTSPDFVPAMKKASAIITDQGGQTSHAAIVSRELGVPCVVGTTSATSLLKEGITVTVDATKGLIYLGGKVKVVEKVKETNYKSGKTATKLYVNLAEPELAKKIAKKNVDGVGLLRAEFMIANIGIHPKEAIKLKKQDDFVDNLAEGIKTFCKAFYPRPVIYRATDFKTNEYKSLPGGKSWEPNEPNPLLGYRGAFRYIADPEVFALELRAIKKVMKNFKNFRLMIPYVRSPQELVKVRRLVSAEGLFEHPSFKFLMMVELPVNIILLDDFLRVGVDGVSIGSNDLTMLVSGTDRDNQSVAQAFNEMSPAVLWCLRKTIKTCNKFGVTSSICGQAPSVYEELVEKLVSWGITSISVNPDAIGRTRSIIYEAEKKLAKV